MSERFERERFVRGCLSLPIDAADIVIGAEEIEFSSGLTSPGFKTHRFSEEAEADFRASSHFRVIAGPLAALLDDCTAQLRDPVAQALGSPWSIVNVRAWITPPGPFDKQMYSLHSDGMPATIFKVMIYFTPMDEVHGGLAFQRVNPEEKPILPIGEPNVLKGPAGSWVLFHNSDSHLWHRGIPGLTKPRAAAEITLMRAGDFDLRLHQPGINAHYPHEG